MFLLCRGCQTIPNNSLIVLLRCGLHVEVCFHKTGHSKKRLVRRRGLEAIVASCPNVTVGMTKRFCWLEDEREEEVPVEEGTPAERPAAGRGEAAAEGGGGGLGTRTVTRGAGAIAAAADDGESAARIGSRTAGWGRAGDAAGIGCITLSIDTGAPSRTRTAEPSLQCRLASY